MGEWSDIPPEPYEDRDVSRGVQIVAGFVTFWLILVAAWVACMAMPDAAAAVGLGVPVAALLLGAVMSEGKGWTAFPKGMMIGFSTMIGLAILGVGACFALCALG